MIKIDSFFFLQTSAYLYVEQREKKLEKKNDLFRNLFFTNTIFI